MPAVTREATVIGSLSGTACSCGGFLAGSGSCKVDADGCLILPGAQAGDWAGDYACVDCLRVYRE